MVFGLDIFNKSSDKKKTLIKNKNTQSYYGHGKLLLSGEYFVLDGAKALALPTTVGQKMEVTYSNSYDPILTWKSYDVNGKLWFESKYEFWHFNCLDERPSDEAIFLQKILRAAREQNKHFLRDEKNIEVETKLGFPLEWGLGSSSTLVYNIAQWAYISPFELQFKTYGGSGYDIACAGSDGPILYEKKSSGPNWSTLHFNPDFQDNIYFVYLGNKQDSREAIEFYKSKRPHSPEKIMGISKITEQITMAKTLEEFGFLLNAHEEIISTELGLDKIKEKRFSDYWGSIKSLGAWGGDFILVTSDKSPRETKKYFQSKGCDVFIPYCEIIKSTKIEKEINNGILQ